MWTHPGKKLLFMGCEFGQDWEWNANESLRWHLLQHHMYKGMQNCVRDLNLMYKGNSCFYEEDFDSKGFEWIDHANGNDSVISYDEAIKTIDEEIKILSKDVNKILELNKINYLNENNEYKDNKIDVTDLLNDLVKKYKLQRRDINWILDIEDKNVLRGTYDIWKLIFDNIFGNFMVYADKEIKVTIKNNKLEFYNDGEKIEDNLIKDIFKQYKKGMKGKFGLGLSIVKKSVELYDYRISVENKEKGVLFKIE